MLRNGNTFINGNMQSALRLLEGLRKFDMTLISSTTLTINGTIIMRQLKELVASGGMIAVKMEPSASMLVIRSLLMAYGMNPIKNGIDENGQMWAFFEKESSERERKRVHTETLLHYVQSATSILCMGEEIADTARTSLEYNHKDKSNRTFIAMYDGVDKTIYEKVKKYSFIYETPLEKIVLETVSATA